MGAPATKPILVEFLVSNGEGDYTLEYLHMNTNLTRGQIQSAVARIMRNDELPGLTVLSRGRIWRYVPTMEAQTEHNGSQARVAADQGGEQWYERVGVTGSGKVIVKPEGDTALFVLVPLEA